MRVLRAPLAWLLAGAARLPKAPLPSQCLHLVSDDPREDLDPVLLKQLEDFAFHRARLEESILSRKKNQYTTTYYLLCMKVGRQREKKKQQQEQKQEKQQK